MVLTPAKPRRMWGVTDRPSEDLYIPMIAIIEGIIDETPDTKTFRLRFADEEYAKSFSWEPGQFAEVTVFGAGEAPIGFSSSPLEKSYLEMAVVARGKTTQAMHQLQRGDRIGIRAPLGNCWPLEEIKGRDLVIISGGCGLAPLRPAILQVLANRSAYGEIWLLYGARTPADRDFKYDLEAWSKRDDFHVLQTVDVADATWKGNVGVVTTLLGKIRVDAKNAIAFTCGPPIMIKYTTLDLLGMGFSEDRVVTSQERYMKCGVGKCGHCCINHFYLCLEGPILTYQQMKDLPELKL